MSLFHSLCPLVTTSLFPMSESLADSLRCQRPPKLSHLMEVEIFLFPFFFALFPHPRSACFWMCHCIQPASEGWYVWSLEKVIGDILQALGAFWCSDCEDFGKEFLIELLLLLGGGWQCTLLPRSAWLTPGQTFVGRLWWMQMQSLQRVSSALFLELPFETAGLKASTQFCYVGLWILLRCKKIYQAEKTNVTIVIHQLQDVLRCETFRVPSLFHIGSQWGGGSMGQALYTPGPHTPFSWAVL